MDRPHKPAQELSSENESAVCLCGVADALCSVADVACHDLHGRGGVVDALRDVADAMLLMRCDVADQTAAPNKKDVFSNKL